VASTSASIISGVISIFDPEMNIILLLVQVKTLLSSVALPQRKSLRLRRARRARERDKMVAARHWMMR
jgi:hypothetical protein